ncbi:SRPBCC domain-containing protein [Galbibacter sp. EGI 63066]|uniref:SRPBCC family protein n=1 Tax=Galbibacter sp. EGI 63066 TaxID=2993559 RepID=UPI0022489DE8|nr:SRPBCC domain-containing protein [Galbibacter sp. EGI 63066]MCX2679288.1 SRPBCC domain-containing protein [Galbibacter sp. EGI 63066]
MKSNLSFEFTVNKETKTVEVKREFGAGLSLVWKVWTDQELLDQWWAPKPWVSKTKSMEFKVGGRRLYAMCGPEGEEHWALADYTVISPKTNFKFLDAFCDKDGNLNDEFPRSNWNVDFKEGEGTTMVNILIKHKELSDLEKIIAMGFKEGFTTAMDGLDELLKTKA